MKIRLTLLLFFPFLSFGQTETFSIGEIHQIESKELKETRILNIHLPRNYSKDSSYPVLYVLDGSAHEDFLHIVGLVQYFQLQFAAPDYIVVGIENVDRKRDFTYYTKDSAYITDFPTSGHSEEFMNFVEKELQPYIETTFKTSGQKMIIGQSLGGLMASEFLFKRPQLFTHYFIVSPSLWWDNESMLKKADELCAKQAVKPAFVYIVVGADEHKIMRREAKSLYTHVDKLKGENDKVYFNKMKHENHATILHNALYQGLENL